MKRLVGALLLAAATVSSLAEAAIITFNNRAAWEVAAGSTTNIDFATYDDGTPITNPPADVFVGDITLKGVTFEFVRSYMNDFIYRPIVGTLHTTLPGSVFSVGADIKPLYDEPGNYSMTVFSQGETYQFAALAGEGAGAYDFFGLISTTPIDWVDFSLDSNPLQMDNFAFGPPSNSVPEPGAAALLLLGLAGVAATRRRVN